MSDPTLEDLLCDQVLGAGSPCPSLIDHGVFPEGWVDRYLEILGKLTEVHTGQIMLPRRAVWAVHFASWYLPLRYNVWCNSSSKSNQHTVGDLARLRTPSEVFIHGAEYKAGG